MIPVPLQQTTLQIPALKMQAIFARFWHGDFDARTGTPNQVPVFSTPTQQRVSLLAKLAAAP